MKKVYNLTGHDVTIGDKTYPVNGSIRLSQSSTIVDELDGCPVSEMTYGPVTIPAKAKDKAYLVSLLVCQHFPDRDDLFIPSGKDRDGKYNSISCNPYFRARLNNLPHLYPY